MNIRKHIDYSDLFKSLSEAVESGVEQMELYAEIGRLVALRTEKGAAVAASEFLQEQYPEKNGFSARNIRRMRDFYLAYRDDHACMQVAMELNWTQNVVILEDCEPVNRAWYLNAAHRNHWTKAQLVEAIEQELHQGESLDNSEEMCYDAYNSKEKSNDEATVCESRKYLPEPNGGVRDEELGCEGGADRQGADRECRNQSRRYWESSVSTGKPVAERAWAFLRRKERSPAGKSRLRKVRFIDRNGPEESAGYVPDLRRRLLQENSLAVGLYRYPWQHRRSVVFRRFCDLLDGYSKRLPGVA